MDHDLELSLARRWRDHGDPKALNALIASQTRLVWVLVRKYYFTQDEEECVAVGNLAICKGARTFDPDRGVRLSTYLSHWIHAYILKHLMDTDGPLRIGGTRDIRVLYWRLAAAQRQLGDGASAERIATHLAVSIENVEWVRQRKGGFRDIPLDAPIRDDGGTYSDRLADEHIGAEDGLAERDEREYLLRRAHAGLSRLDPRTRDIVERRLLHGDTLKTLGARHGLSRERVRQLEAKGIKRLRKAVENE